jgi:hypothetical protein
MDFFRNFNNYKPKDFKGKTEKDILAMKPNKVPDDFFSAEYATKYAKEFADAGLMEEQLNAIQLLSDLKDKSIILKKCYTKKEKHSLVPGHMKRSSPMVQAKALEPVEEATQTAQPEQEKQVQEQQVQEQQVQEQQVQEQTGGRRSRKRRGRKSKKHTKRTKRSRTKQSRTKQSRTKQSRTKRSRTKHRGGTLVMTPGN